MSDATPLEQTIYCTANKQEDVLIELSTTWPLLPLLSNNIINHTPHAEQQKTDSYFET